MIQWLNKRIEESNKIQMLIVTLNFIYNEISNLKR